MYPSGLQGIDAQLQGIDYTQHGRMAQPFGSDFYTNPYKFTGWGVDPLIYPFPKGPSGPPGSSVTGLLGLGAPDVPDSSIASTEPPLLTPNFLGAIAGAAAGGALLGWVVSGRQAAITGAIMNVGLLSLGTLITSNPPSTAKTLLFGGITAIAAAHVYRRRFR